MSAPPAQLQLPGLAKAKPLVEFFVSGSDVWRVTKSGRVRYYGRVELVAKCESHDAARAELARLERKP